MRSIYILLISFFAAAAIAPCAGAADVMWGRNGIAPSLTNLGPIGNGRRVWLKLNCYSCHGDNAAGGMGPNVQQAEKRDVSAAMLQGDAREGGMRSFAKYATQTDANNVAAYLQSIGTKNEPTWLDWWKAHP